MRGNSRAAWASDDDNTAFALFIVVGGSIILAVLAWVSFHTEISAVAANWILLQIRVLSPIVPSLAPLADKVLNADPSRVTVPEIAHMLGVVDAPLRWPVAGGMMVLAVICFFKAAPAQFTRALDLDGLIAEQARWARPLAPFLSRRLKLVPLKPDTLRPSDPALHPGEWIDRFARDEDGRFDEAKARAALIVQLGTPWCGVKYASPLVRFLFAAFAVHLAQKRTDAQGLLGDFAEALPKGNRKEAAGSDKPHLFPEALSSIIDEILADKDIEQPAGEIAARHAFTVPALMAVLTAARRRGGVLAPAQFAGLKLVDRSLWYALHSLGFEGDGPGQTTHPNPRIEAAAARDHWESERLVGHPIIIPSIERTVQAIRVSTVHNP
jgi:intracellular multiplication protein IcmP